MSKRGALLLAIVVGVVLAAIFLWPEPARADFSISGRVGGSVAGHSHGGSLHHGGAGVRGGVHIGHGGVRGRLHLGAGYRDKRLSHKRGHARGLLLGDRFRLHQQLRLGGGPGAKGVLLGDRMRFRQQRRLDDGFLGREHRRDVHSHWQHDRDRLGKRRGHGHHRHHRHHRRHHGKWLAPAPHPLRHGGASVVVREIIVPVLVPVPANRPAERLPEATRKPVPLDPRGRAAFVGEGDGIVGDWAAGDILPRNVPHVTLDPIVYGLPQPPSGEKYARVGNDVLRIDTGSRRITEVVAR